MSLALTKDAYPVYYKKQMSGANVAGLATNTSKIVPRVSIEFQRPGPGRIKKTPQVGPTGVDGGDEFDSSGGAVEGGGTHGAVFA